MPSRTELQGLFQLEPDRKYRKQGCFFAKGGEGPGVTNRGGVSHLAMWEYSISTCIIHEN